MTNVDDRFAKALGELAETAPHDEALARTVRRLADVRASRPVRRRRMLVSAAASASVLAVVGTSYLLADDDNGSPPASSEGPAGCRPTASRLLPAWARSGFTAPYRATYVTSARGDLIAVLFGPLRAPQPEGSSNKVLWLSRRGVTDPVRIDGRLPGSSLTTRTVLPDGLGPSTVDVPRPGCWRLSLAWPGDHDSIDLEYAAGPR